MTTGGNVIGEGRSLKRPVLQSAKRTAVALAAAIIGLQSIGLRASAAPLPSPQIAGTSGILVERESGRVLWAVNPDKRQAIASTTKMMTALVAVDKLSLDSGIEVNPGVLMVDESGLGFKRGEKLTANQLLYSMLLYSANDAATAIAYKVAGSPGAFAGLMNKKADALRLSNTHFVNPHGLDAPGHYSTARDLSVIARELLNNSVLSKIVSTKAWVLERQTGRERLENRNQLLSIYQYANGIKTGHTEKAGYCLVSSAKKDRTELVAVVLGVPEDYAAEESKRVLEYGFSLYSNKRLATKGQVYKSVSLPYGKKANLVAAKDFMAVVREGSALKVQVRDTEINTFPVRKGNRYGEVALVQDGKVLGIVPLVTDRAVETPSLGEKISFTLRSLFRKLASALG